MPYAYEDTHRPLSRVFRIVHRRYKLDVTRSQTGSDIHVMLGLRRSSRQVVVADKR